VTSGTVVLCARTRCRGLAAVISSLLALPGCSYGLFQTGHTQPPKSLGGSLGASVVFNELDGQGGRDFLTRLGLDPNLRFGLTDHLDVGLGAFFGEGASIDAKYDVFNPDAPLALAPRIGFGYGFQYDTFMAEGGAIASYRANEMFEPYLALSFANVWIGAYPPPEAPPPPGALYAARTGLGNGLLKAIVGVQIPAHTGLALMIEYGHWFPLEDDPGDYYAFVATNVLGVGMHF
jgi:hypothetical protein